MQNNYNNKLFVPYIIKQTNPHKFWGADWWGSEPEVTPWVSFREKSGPSEMSNRFLRRHRHSV